MTLVGNTHVVAGGSEAIPRILEILAKEGLSVVGNPDLYVREYSGFGIEEARELRERASLRPVGDRRVFIITTSGITAEAQNALLKTLEDPPADALFFFIVPSPHTLLPTLRSRAQILNVETAAHHSVDAMAFLAAPISRRMDLLKPLLEKGDDEKRDMQSIAKFLSSLEHGLAKQPESLRAVYRARKYLGDKGALIKPLLEQVALLVPHV